MSHQNTAIIFKREKENKKTGEKIGSRKVLQVFSSGYLTFQPSQLNFFLSSIILDNAKHQQGNFFFLPNLIMDSLK